MPAKKSRALAFEDPTDRRPNLPPKGVKSVRVEVISVVEWYDGWQLHLEGKAFVHEFPADDDGNPIFPEDKDGNPMVVLPEDYEPEQVDLPGTNLSRGRRQVRGGASGMPQL